MCKFEFTGIIRLVFSRFFDIRGNLGNVKEKLVSPAK